MATNSERQAKLRALRKASGLVPLTCYVPADQAADIALALRQLCENRGLELGPLRDPVSGKLVKRAK